MQELPTTLDKRKPLILAALGLSLLLISIAANPRPVTVHPVIVQEGMPTVYLVSVPDYEPGAWTDWEGAGIIDIKECPAPAILVVSHLGADQVRRGVLGWIHNQN